MATQIDSPVLAAERVQAQADRAGMRDSILSELGNEPTLEAAPADGGGEDSAAPETETDAPVDDDPTEPDLVPDEEDDEEAAPVEEVSDEPSLDDAVDAAEEPEVAPETVKAKPDLDMQRRLAELKRAEKRQKDAIAQERASLTEERKRLEQLAEKAEHFESLMRRALSDPSSLLLAAGYTEDTLEIAAKHNFARSSKGKADPKLQEQVARDLRDLEHKSESAATRRELAELRNAFQALQGEKNVSDYMTNVQAAVSDETPLVKNMLAKNPKGTSEKLRKLADQITRETEEVPDPADVVRELEKIRLEELEESGVDTAQFRVRQKTKTKTQPAVETKKAKTLTNDLPTTTTPKAAPKTREDLRKDVLANMPI